MISNRALALTGAAIANGVVVAVAAPDWRLAANILLALLMAKAAVFVVLYGLRSNWRQTAPGRAVMGLIACIATICGVGVVGAFLGNYPGKPFVRVAAFIAVGLTLMNLLLVLIDTQRNQGDG